MVKSTKSAHIVVGLGFGDEGKGSVTNHLCSATTKQIVIRFNGGHQAGHTVVLPNGKKHVFSSFGSGTLISVPTYWSSYCTVSPAHLLAEYHSLDIQPQLNIDGNCPITTHYDVLYNRALETFKGSKRNGSCGVGFGATVDRHFGQSTEFKYRDLNNTEKVVERLHVIREYYRSKIDNETNFDFKDFDHDKADKDFIQSLAELHILQSRNIIQVVDEAEIFNSENWDTYIFEGAQGILLDRTFGSAPHITKSNTSSENAIEILKRNFSQCSFALDIHIHYVSRAYLTRHGAGPFPTSSSDIDIINNSGETNIFNEYQGVFKIGNLNIDLLKRALEWDDQFSSKFSKHLIITCVDQISGDMVSVFHNNSVSMIRPIDIPSILTTKFETIRLSYDPSMQNFKQM